MTDKGLADMIQQLQGIYNDIEYQIQVCKAIQETIFKEIEKLAETRTKLAKEERK